MNKFLKINLLLGVFIIFFIPLIVFAQNPILDAANTYSGLTDTQLITIFTNLAQWFLAIVGVLAVIIALWSAFQYMTSGGDEQKLSRAKKTLIYALIGTAIAILAFAIVSFTKSLIDPFPSPGITPPTPPAPFVVPESNCGIAGCPGSQMCYQITSSTGFISFRCQ